MRAQTHTMYIFTLDNGMTCVLIPTGPSQGGNGIVSTSFVYNVGSKDELNIQEGCAHLFEHLGCSMRMFKEAHGNGVEINASTSSDRTAFTNTCRETCLLWLFEQEYKRMFKLHLTPDDVRRESLICINEGKLGENVLKKMMDVIRRSMFHHGYDHSPAGNEVVLRAFTADKAKEWYRAFYNPSRCVALICGSFDVQETEEKFRQIFEGAENTEIPLARPIVRLKTHQTSIKMHNQKCNMIFLAYKGPKGMSQEAIDLCVLREILNGNKGTLKANNLWSHAECVWNRSRDESMFMLVAWLNDKNAKPAKRELLAKLKGIKEGDIERVKRDLSTSWSSRGTSRDIVEMLSDCVALGSVMDCVARIEALNNVTVKSLKNTVDLFLCKDRCVKLVTIGGKAHPEPVSTPLPKSEIRGGDPIPLSTEVRELEPNIRVAYRDGPAYLVELWECSEGAGLLAEDAYFPSKAGVEREIKSALGGILVTYTFPMGTAKENLDILRQSLSGDPSRARMNRRMENSDPRNLCRFLFSKNLPEHKGRHSEMPSIPHSFSGKLIRVSYSGPRALFMDIQKIRRWKCADPRSFTPRNSKHKIYECRQDGEATWVRMGWMVDYNESDPRFAPLKVAVSKLGLGMLCDVMQELRIKTRLTYTAAAFCQPVGESTIVCASASFSKGKYKEGVEAMKQVIERWLKSRWTLPGRKSALIITYFSSTESKRRSRRKFSPSIKWRLFST